MQFGGSLLATGTEVVFKWLFCADYTTPLACLSSTFCKLQKIGIDWPSLSKPGRVRDNCLQFGQGGEKPR